MRIRLHSANELSLEEFGDGAFTVEPDDPGTRLGPREMFVASIGLCSYAMLATFEEADGADPWDLSIHLAWQYLDHPVRIGRIELEVDWPDLPVGRREAALAQIHRCVLIHSVEKEIEVVPRIRPVAESGQPARQAGD